jgi:hypothetical protein
MAGAELQIQNPRYDHIEIRAAFPINVQIGNCSSTNTVDYQCDGAVADISALDLRAGADPSSAAANSVQVIARDSTVHPVRTYLVHRHSTFHISNSRCREIQVHAEGHALAISNGECTDSAAYDFHCESSSPADINLTNPGQPSDPPTPVTVTCLDR